MANVKVAVRVRPPNAREAADGGRLAVQVEEKFVRIQNVKLDGRTEHTVDSREKLLEFCFDYCYWSVHPEDPHYASQEEVFQDLGESVLAGAHEGYNVCLFAYGQTGSGKTYTMMGTPDSIGLTPRICQGLFWSDDALPDGQNSSRVEISFLEIYNERVRDLLRVGEQKKRASLRVREHPEKGPYVQDLSQHVVSDSKQAMVLLEEGIANRITAATHNHDASSRSHAIFTIQYTQAILENNRPSETVSKINLVDLAGSERADHNYCRDRLTEGSNINKSLVTLGIVISALAQNSQMSSSCHSINSMASEGDKSTAGSHSSSLSRGGGGGRRHYFIPYRDSVLTWLLKDSLGGNSKTIMIATVSPSASSYNETLSTLRYAAHARNIVNKPRVNEDANVRLIRELREEIDRLKSMLLTYEMRNHSPSLSDERDGALSDIVLQNELKVEQLMKDWSESWIDQNYLLQQYKVDINSMQPHLISLDRDGLCTGIVVYNLPEGITRIGPRGRAEEPHIVLQGGASCEIENHEGVVTLRPLPDAVCLLNEREINEPCRLAQGAVITLGGVHKFLLNHPTEAALHQEQTRAVKSNMPCTFIDLCIKGGAHCGEKTMLQGEAPHCTSLNDQTAARQRVEKQQRYVESLLQDMHCEQRKAEKELEREQALLQQQHSELQTWIDQEKERLLMVERRATQELGVQTDLVSPQVLDQLSSFVSADQNSPTGIFPSQLDRERKKVVNQELIKHHALCRAASRIHRSRLQFQLKRIANKRCMLEAKRELQSLEKALPSGLEGLDSADFGSKCPGDSFASRRHSFTSDLRSRRHCSVSRHAVKRNQHATSATSICSRTWVSDDCLPRERTQSCSGSLFSGQSCQDEKRLCAKDETPLPFPKCPERKPLLPNRDLTFKNWSNVVTSRSPVSSATQKTGQENFLSTTKEERVCHTASTGSVATACDASAVSSGQGTTEELHGLVTPKKIFSKGFRQPSFSNEERGPKALRRVMKKMHWRQQRGLSLDRKRPGSKRGVNSAVSCDDLDQTCLLQGFSQRRCHSADALMSQTKRWVETQPELTGWVEEEKEVKWDEERSDCDSLFSLDSLSSAYAAVLADQLKSKEDAWGCGAESEDSNMSKDSLTVVSRQKCTSMKKLSKALHPLLVQESPRVSPREKGDHGASAALDLRTRNSDSGTVRTPEKKSETQSSIFSNIYIHPLNVDRETLHDPAVGPQMSLSDSLGQLKHRDVAFSSKVFTSVPATALALNNKSSAQVHCSDKAKGPSTTLGESLLETDNHSSTGEAKFPVVRYESPHERPTIVRNPSQSPEEEIGKLPVETSICSAAHSCTNSSELIYDSGCCMKLPTDDHNPDDSAEDVDQYELPDDISLSRDETLDETLPPGIVDSGSIEERQQALMGNVRIPKRDIVTHCSTPAGARNRLWLRASSAERDQTPEAIEDRNDSLASVVLPGSDPIALKCGAVSNKLPGSEDGFPCCKQGSKVHEHIVATKAEKIKGLWLESCDTKHWPRHISQSEAICSAIDLRISEVVKEHVRLSDTGSTDERNGGHRPFQSSTCPFCRECSEHRRTDNLPTGDPDLTGVSGLGSLGKNKLLTTWTDFGLSNTHKGGQEKGHLTLTKGSACLESAPVLSPSQNLSTAGVKSCREFLESSGVKEQVCTQEDSSLERGQNPVVMNDQLDTGNGGPDSQINYILQRNVDNIDKWANLLRPKMDQNCGQLGSGGKNSHGSDVATIPSSGTPKIVRCRCPRRRSGNGRPSRSSISCCETSSDEDDKTPRHRRNSRPSSRNVNADPGVRQVSFIDTVESTKSRKITPYIGDNSRKKYCLQAPNSLKPDLERETDKSRTAVGSQDSIMHFASSDINPFVHHRQDSSQQSNNTQAFGSAADLSCKSVLLNSAEKRIMRCSSVDDGLNGQNSPFLSHLSTYAQNKRLSSTLSSFEDCQVKKEFAHKPEASPGGKTTAHTVATGSSPSCSQVDEIMFLYSSETESNKAKVIRRTKECGRGPTESYLRHKRSATDGAATKKVPIEECPTWASMESMSVHLSRLIDSTSDLLGDVQGMRAGGACGSVHVPGTKRQNSFTQTSRLDSSNRRVCSACPRTHEVNVTVKVVGAEVCTGTQNQTGHHTATNKNLREADLNSATETLAVVSGANCQGRARSAPRLGPVRILPEELRNLSVSGSTEVGSPAQSSSRDAQYMDRASSPIVTVGSKTQTRPNHSNACQTGSGSQAQLIQRCQQALPFDQSSKEEWDISSLEIDPKPLDSEVSYPSPKECCGSLPSSLGGYRGTEPSHAFYKHLDLSVLLPQEDDAVSLAPSECNTDVLVNAQPLSAWMYPSSRTLPQDLPMHNKFKNWSGIPNGQPRHRAQWCSPVVERLRQERRQVMATVCMEPLTTEQTAPACLLKKDAGFKEVSQPHCPIRQQLYDRHRRSIEGLRQEREHRLQTSRRARSLSPRRHSRLTSSSSVNISDPHAEKVPDNIRLPGRSRAEGLHPSAIEQLLLDYGRAREEARTEIARARERLRERTEQDKKRLLQQASHQEPRDEPKLRTRISSSTLCTGSSISLSSGPTSGYNSGNTVQRGRRPGQAVGFQEEECEVSTCPSPCGKGQPTRLSAQDLWPNVSLGSTSSICSRFQDVTCSLLDRIFAEVRHAATGGLSPLLMGKAAAGWGYQGEERGVHSFYKPSPNPSVLSFLAAAELERPLESLWRVISQPSKAHLYHPSVSSIWTRPLDDSTHLVYMLTDPSSCHLKQPRDFCCVSKAAKQGGLCVLAMQSVCEESLPPPRLGAVRGEMLPSCWLLQPVTRRGKEVTRVIALLQIDLGLPSIPPHLLNTVARQHTSVISHLNSYLDSTVST